MKSQLNYIASIRTDARIVAGLLRWLSNEAMPQASVSKGLHTALAMLQDAVDWDRFETVEEASTWLGNQGFLATSGDPDRVKALAKGLKVEVGRERAKETAALTEAELDEAFD